MDNLKELITKEYANDLERSLDKLKDFTKKDIKEHWVYYDCLTQTRKNQFNELELDKIKEIIFKKLAKDNSKQLNKRLDMITTAENPFSLKECTITIEWKRSATWGSNPHAILRGYDNEGNFFTSEATASGCGYCKESTVIAECLNQIPAIMKLLYEVKDKFITSDNESIFSYGVSGLLPSFSGGVGTSCFVRNFEHLGYTMKHIVSGKSFDVFTINIT